VERGPKHPCVRRNPLGDIAKACQLTGTGRLSDATLPEELHAAGLAPAHAFRDLVRPSHALMGPGGSRLFVEPAGDHDIVEDCVRIEMTSTSPVRCKY
jgi:hypothetical protein